MIVQKIADWPGERALYEQLYEGLPVAMPDLEQREWPEPSGVIAGHEQGMLVGFVVFFAALGQPEPSAIAIVQWILARRERERIVSGSNTQYRAGAAEIEALAILVSAAADGARKAGYQVLEWGGAEVDLAERLAEQVGAHEDNGRHRLTLLLCTTLRRINNGSRHLGP